MSRPLSVAALSALLLAVVPAVADAKTFRGKSSQGKGVRVVTASGFAKRVIVNWTADCGSRPAYKASTAFPMGEGSASRDGAKSYGAYTVRFKGGYRVRINARMRAVPAGAGWRGNVTVTVRVRRNGRTIARCATGALTFTAGAAAPAGPVKSYVGQTSQRRVVTLTTRPDGSADRLWVYWSAKCGDRDVFVSQTFFDQMAVATPDALHDSGSYRPPGHRGERYRVFGTLDGKRTVSASGERWSGTLAIKVVVTKRGKVTTRCQFKRVRWSADLT